MGEKRSGGKVGKIGIFSWKFFLRFLVNWMVGYATVKCWKKFRRLWDRASGLKSNWMHGRRPSWNGEKSTGSGKFGPVLGRFYAEVVVGFRTYLQAVAMREAAAKKTEAEEVSKEDVKAEESKETNDGGNTGDYPGMDSNFVAREMFGLFPSEDTAVVESPLPEAPSQTTYIDPDAADIWAVEDINDLDGKGTPLYGKFQAEDWQLLNLRYELHLLCHAFFRDATAEDGDIKGIHRSLLQHYFSTYFVGHPPLIASLYGGKSVDELLDTFVVDTITVGSDGVLKTVHDIDTPQSTFVRLVESARRERQKRIEAGDESARIRIVQPVTAPRNSGGRGPTVRDNRNSGSRGGKGGVSHPGKYYGHHHQQQQQHPHNRCNKGCN